MKSDRRQVLASAGAAVLLAALRPVGARAADQPLRVRPEASTDAGEQMLKIYADAVKEMWTRPAYEPTSWWFQANIHVLPSSSRPGEEAWGSQDPAELDRIFTAPGAPIEQQRRIHRLKELALGIEQSPGVWSTCPHHTLDETFLPWHRIYLALFERTVEHVARQIGALEQSEHFALPYWNYLAADKRKLPEAFLPAPAGQSNPLSIPNRGTGTNGGADIITDMVLTPNLFSQKCNEHIGGWSRAAPKQKLLGACSFAAHLETAPHDYAHDAVGGWMGSPPRAARDPVFWLHHAQIDRLWESWRVETMNPDPAETDLALNGKPWFEGGPMNFAGLDDTFASFSIKQTLATQVLQYGYDRLEPTSSPFVAAAPAPAEVARGPGVAVGTSASVVLGEGFSDARLVDTRPPFASAPGVARHYFLRFVGVRAPDDPGCGYVVTVTRRDGRTPPGIGPVARLNLFGRFKHHRGDQSHAAPASITLEFDVTSRFARGGDLRGAALEDLNVRIAATGIAETQVSIERIELVER